MSGGGQILSSEDGVSQQVRAAYPFGRAMFAVRVVVVFLTGPVAGHMWWIFLLAAAAGAVVAMCFRRAD